MDILDRAIDRKDPKVRPLAQALLAVAIEQGVTVREFDLACQRILDEARGTFLLRGLADFVSEI